MRDRGVVRTEFYHTLSPLLDSRPGRLGPLLMFLRAATRGRALRAGLRQSRGLYGIKDVPAASADLLRGTPATPAGREAITVQRAGRASSDAGRASCRLPATPTSDADRTSLEQNAALKASGDGPACLRAVRFSRRCRAGRGAGDAWHAQACSGLHA